MSYTPPFVSQRTPNDGTLDDCTWAAGAMLVAKMTMGATVPSWAALRAASGDTGPSSLDDLRRGASKLLGITIPVKSLGWSALLAELGKGSGAVVQGTYERLPAKYRTVSPSSRGGHAAYVQDCAGDTVAWFDPLGNGAVRLPVEYLKSFMSGYGRVAIAREGSAAAPKTADVVAQPGTSTPGTSNQGQGGAEYLFRSAVLAAFRGSGLTGDTVFTAQWSENFVQYLLEARRTGGENIAAFQAAWRKALAPFIGRKVKDLPEKIAVYGVPAEEPDDLGVPVVGDALAGIPQAITGAAESLVTAAQGLLVGSAVIVGIVLLAKAGIGRLFED